MNKRQIKKFKKRGGVKKYSTAIENELMFTYYLIGSRRRACAISPVPIYESQKIKTCEMIAEQYAGLLNQAIKKFK